MNANDRRLPIALLVIALVLAPAMLGVSYGLWSDQLEVNGVVHTGEVDAGWYFALCNEFHTWPNEMNPGEFEGKDVGSWSIQIDPQNDQLLHFTINNGYPSYAVDCSAKYIVKGSIPVVVRGLTIIPVSGLTNCQLSNDPDENTKKLTCDQLTVIFQNGVGLQLHPGAKTPTNLMVHVEQQAAENATYEFDAVVCVAQWNESATLEECLAAAP
jgi:hypothetical protein